MRKFIRILIVFGLIAYFGFEIHYRLAVERPMGQKNEAVVFEVKSGENVETIAKNLFDNNLIVSSNYFKRYVKKQDIASFLQAGTYSLSPILSIKEIARVFVEGETISREKTVKFIEGWNMRDMNSYLLENKIVSDDEFIGITSRSISMLDPEVKKIEFLSLLPQAANLEGFLFPDTYRIFNDSDAGYIVSKMLKNFNEKLSTEMRDEINRQGRSLYEVVTLASIVEKEVRSEDDMKLVAGVFLNRINSGQPLESCATLAYILGVNKRQYTIEDTQIDSPYNTYRNQGLPPGPICNPGLQAIKAAINPTHSDYNYFLSSFDNGETVFSKTYAEHLRNKENFLK